MTNNDLKKIRLSLNLTQLQLAKCLHVSEATISRWERGLWPIPDDKAELFRYKFIEDSKYINMKGSY